MRLDSVLFLLCRWTPLRMYEDLLRLLLTEIGKLFLARLEITCEEEGSQKSL